MELDSQEPSYAIHLGLELEKAGRLAGAIRCLEGAVKLGSNSDYSVSALESRLSRLRLQKELAQLAPFSSEAKHDHLFGDCQGRLDIDSERVSFQAEKGGAHSFEASLSKKKKIEGEGDRLTIEMPGKKFHFKVSSAERFAAVHRLTQQLRE